MAPNRTDELLDGCPLGELLPQLVKDAVVLANLGLADSLARRYDGRGMDCEDLRQVARLGLTAAAHRYRPGLGASFAGYATPTILGEIRRHFRDTGWMVRPPRDLQELNSASRVAAHQLEQQLQRSPTVEDIAHFLDIAPERVVQAQLAGGSFRAASLDRPTASGQPPAAALIADDADDFAAWEHLTWLDGTLHTATTARERLVLRLRFEDELTQSQIGARLGLSQMQVSRILTATLARLKAALTASLDAA